LPQFGLGLTDIVRRATANSSFVSAEEFVEGAKLLRAKLEPLAPRVICFVGLVGYRQGVDPKAKLGEQREHWGESRLFIVPSTSPRNAYYRPAVVNWFKRLKEFRDQLREEQNND
jgi:TDG/mug DNA glycosylase family protein